MQDPRGRRSVGSIRSTLTGSASLGSIRLGGLSSPSSVRSGITANTSIASPTSTIGPDVFNAIRLQVDTLQEQLAHVEEQNMEDFTSEDIEAYEGWICGYKIRLDQNVVKPYRDNLLLAKALEREVKKLSVSSEEIQEIFDDLTTLKAAWWRGLRQWAVLNCRKAYDASEKMKMVDAKAEQACRNKFLSGGFLAQEEFKLKEEAPVSPES